ncbi:hypothetical protein TRFO_32117 [Tritrichomonas foetus]|uniref:Legumain n=1 Tax=Tritrichomonas foetus TaxID=1144522 RepID=A0A1J4JPU0_9EUKA|nr:hypothetical protein TRFO_32117 [Tritrichomonas foetus]|eukprot:OHT01175.1 hypothetical protein TRFO_32117 [Tritrichomonas foetus]
MFSLFLALVACDNWAVIFTGSSDYGNYRHTADSFYQYYLLVEGGIPKDHIILMNYNDWSYARYNPFPGQIFRNLEHDPNVYPGGDSIDYKECQVTAKNFYNVLKGDTVNGRALQSNENDNVFVFFDDHGGDGVLGVPEPCGFDIYADELAEALQYMYDNKMYKKLFFPITACYAGSVARVLDGIPNLYIHY